MNELLEGIFSIWKQLDDPDIRPQPFDRTLDAWLYRISLWGRLNIYWIPPGAKSKKRVTKGQFLKAMSTPDFLNILGKWDVKKLDINQVEFSRGFTDFDGRKVVEKFIVEVELKPEIKKRLKI